MIPLSFVIGENWKVDELLPVVMEVGEVNLKCMALLDKANTETYGTPEPTTVPLTVEKLINIFVSVSKHSSMISIGRHTSDAKKNQRF